MVDLWDGDVDVGGWVGVVSGGDEGGAALLLAWCCYLRSRKV